MKIAFLILVCAYYLQELPQEVGVIIKIISKSAVYKILNYFIGYANPCERKLFHCGQKNCYIIVEITG